MPITITNPLTQTDSSVTISNTLGYAVNFKVTLTDCTGKAYGTQKAYTSGTISLASGHTWTVPQDAITHRLVTFTVVRSQAQAGTVQAAADLVSRQGCPAPSTAPQVSVPTGSHYFKGLTGVAVQPAKPQQQQGSTAAGLIGLAVCLVLLVLMVMGLRRLYKAVRRPRGRHA